MRETVRPPGAMHTIQQSEIVRHQVNFFRSYAYRGEQCVECGHPWSEKGELHYKRCSYYVSGHTIHQHSMHRV